MLKSILNTLYRRGYFNTIHDNVRDTFNHHTDIIEKGESKFFHINKPYIAQVEKGESGVPHIYTNRLHYCAAAMICDKRTDYCLGAVHFSGENHKEIKQVIHHLDKIKSHARVIIGNNENANLHPLIDSEHYSLRIKNINHLVKTFTEAGFETNLHEGAGKVLGICAIKGVFQGE